MRFNPGRSAGAAVGALAVASTLLGCSDPQSFIVLVVESANPTPITGVAELRVVVSKGATTMKTLTYSAGDLTLVADADTSRGTLSVGFSGGETGDVTFDVQALDAQGCEIGERMVILTIKKGATNEGVVALGPVTGCPTPGGPTDGGGSDGGDGGTAFGGCDPAHPQCAVPGQTCQVNCDTQLNACLTGGTTAAGAPCGSSTDCGPGTQCFDYSGAGCAIKLCLPFCDSDTDCGGFGGAGPGSFCRDPVVCPGLTTAAHTCTFSCDPTAAAAAAAGSGCPSGLACLMTATMDQVDCACPGTSRVGREGAACTSSSACAPGLICNAQGGTLTCRPVCRCDAVAGSCTATTNDCPTAGTHCTVVTNQTIYGICL